jgi:hypothetical protein
LDKLGVTLQLLHEEYKRGNPDGYERTQFYHLYHSWGKRADPVIMSLCFLIVVTLAGCVSCQPMQSD